MRPVYVDEFAWHRSVRTTWDRRTYSYMDTHTHIHTHVSRRQSLSIYLSTNLPAATQYETRVTMTFTKGICDMLAWKMIIVIAPPAFGTSFRSFPTRSIDTICQRISGDMVKNAFARICEFVVIENRVMLFLFARQLWYWRN